MSIEGREFRIVDFVYINNTTFHKIESGNVTWTVYSYAENNYSCPVSLSDSSVLILRLHINGQGHVVDVQYAISQLTREQESYYNKLAKTPRLSKKI